VKTVAVSGGFDPVHIGHIRLLEAAKKLGDKLVVIINNDAWLTTFKKEKPFMPEEERVEIIKALRAVDEVVLTDHVMGDEDRSVARTLRKVCPDIFANGGDRDPKLDDVPTPEYEICKELGIQMVWGVGGEKIQSSSWLTK
jgi:cytidyltransferase-like protein